MTEPGQPCVMISGSASSCWERDVDEVDLDPVDLGRELRQRVEPRLALAPVVVGRPVAGELLQRRQLHALRPIRDELLGWASAWPRCAHAGHRVCLGSRS